MGTRADFYVGIGEHAEWLGSIAWDGHPDGISETVLKTSQEQEFREAVNELISSRDDGTFPKDGWPWPWEDSQTTDYAYAFDVTSKKVMASCFGCKWFDPLQSQEDDPAEDNDKSAIFPNMKKLQKTTFGKRSGVMIFGM